MHHSLKSSLLFHPAPVHLLTVALALFIRSAYRKLSKKFHPDRNKEKSAEERFLKISQAYDVLSDEEMRQVYDQHVRLLLVTVPTRSC